MTINRKSLARNFFYRFLVTIGGLLVAEILFRMDLTLHDQIILFTVIAALLIVEFTIRYLKNNKTGS